MTTPHTSLTLQLLEWIADRPRTHAELMDAWKTTCPRLVVFLTDKGRQLLQTRAVAG